MKMTQKELSFLTMKQIREYAVMQGAKKVPKKWKDKLTALAWVEKNLENTSEVKTSKSTKKPAKAVSVKPAKKKTARKGNAMDRRENMVELLKKEAMTATELADKFGIKYKSVLDDMHAIRHNRNSNQVANRIYLKNDEVLLGVYINKVKVFQVCKKTQAKKVEIEIKEKITVA